MTRFGLWSAARLPSAVYGHSPSQTALRFSTAGRPPPLGSEPTGQAGSNAVPRSEVGHGRLRAANPEEAGGLNVGKGCTDRAFRKEAWRKFRAEAASSSRAEEFRNLRNDDFPKQKASARLKPFPLERAKGFEILFGVAPCSLALARAKRTFGRLFLKDGGSGPSATAEQFSQLAEDRGIPVQRLHRKVLNALCKGGVHQGVCLEATPLRPIGWRKRPPREAEDTTAREGPQLLWLALDGILDPMNLGAILRSAHFLGVDGIVMSERNSCPLTPVVSKASSGAMEVLDVFGTDDLQSFLQEKSKQGWELLGTVGHAKAQDGVPVVSCVDFRWTRPTILVLGNEGYGLSPETKSLCRKMLTISPGRELPPGIESLNVSVAAGIILHTLSSQRN